MDIKNLGSLKVLEVVDNPDGTCTIHFDVSEDFQANLVREMGWPEWSQERFEKLVLEALENAVKNKLVDRIED
jgi:hypothetical protein